MEITLTDRTLEVRAARKLEREDGARSTARRSGRFHASYALPEGVDGESLSAHLEDGVLTIRVPKPAKAQPRRIEIRTGNEPAQLSR